VWYVGTETVPLTLNYAVSFNFQWKISSEIIIYLRIVWKNLIQSTLICANIRTHVVYKLLYISHDYLSDRSD